MRPSRSLCRARRRVPSLSSSRFHPRASSYSLSISRSASLSLFHRRSFSLSRAHPPYLALSPSAFVPVVLPPSLSPSLFARIVAVSLSKLLFPLWHVTTPFATRSVLVESPSPGLSRPASLRSSRSRSPPLPVIPSLLVFVLGSLFFSQCRSLFAFHLSRSPAVSLSDQRSLARRSYIGPCLLTSARVCARFRRPSRARSVRRDTRMRIAPICVTKKKGKKNKHWTDVSSALVTTACKYAATDDERTRRACTGSVEELLPFLSVLPFCIGPAFRIYICALPALFAAGHNTRRMSDGRDT